MEKKKINIYPVQPLDSIWDKIGTLILVCGVLIGFIGFYFLGSNIILAAFVALCLSFFLIVKVRNSQPASRCLLIGTFFPFVIGGFLSLFPFGSIIPFLVGLGISSSVVLYSLYFRHSPSHRAAYKAFQSGEQTQALLYINQTLVDEPAKWEAHQLRSVIHLNLSKLSEAENDARKAIEYGPNQYSCHNALGIALLAQKRFSEAKEVFLKSLALAPRIGINYYNLGLAFYRNGDYQDAINYFKIALNNKLPPESILLGTYYLGNCFLRIGESDKAEITYQEIKKHKVGYDRLISSSDNSIDHPGLKTIAQELVDIKKYLD